MHLDLLWDLWNQPRPWPCLRVHTPAKPAVANIGPAPDTKAPIIPSDVNESAVAEPHFPFVHAFTVGLL